MEQTVTVEGMQCASCASGIEVFLKSQDGIESADVDYDTKQVRIVYTEDTDLSACWKQVEAMGYEVQTNDD